MPAQAYTAITHEANAPYEVRSIEESLTVEQWYLGELTQFPEMYEIGLIATTSLPISLKIPATEDVTQMRPTLLIVRDVDPRGVEEVMRVPFEATGWIKETDIRSGLAYFASPPLTVELAAGVYRIEVSSPNNLGKYMLVMGSDVTRPSWGVSFATVRSLYDFYGVSKMLMVRSPVLYYPLGIIVVLGLLVLMWWYRGRWLVR